MAVWAGGGEGGAVAGCAEVVAEEGDVEGDGLAGGEVWGGCCLGEGDGGSEEKAGRKEGGELHGDGLLGWRCGRWVSIVGWGVEAGRLW